MTRRRLALWLIAGGAYALLSHWMMLYHAAAPWAVLVLLGPLWLTALGLAGSHLGRWGTALVAAAGLAFFVLVWRGDAGDPNRLYVLQHVAINALLGGWFGSTLRGELSLIGQFAARIHALVPAMVRYTWKVTLVWTLYFVCVAIGSTLVYFALPFSSWSFFSNLITPVACIGLFVGEHFARYWLHPEFERTRMIDAIRAFYGSPADQGRS